MTRRVKILNKKVLIAKPRIGGNCLTPPTLQFVNKGGVALAKIASRIIHKELILKQQRSPWCQIKMVPTVSYA